MGRAVEGDITCFYGWRRARKKGYEPKDKNTRTDFFREKLGTNFQTNVFKCKKSWESHKLQSGKFINNDKKK